MSASVRKRIKDLVRIGDSTVWSRDPEIASQKTVDTLANVLGSEYVCIHVLDISGDNLNLCATHCTLPTNIQRDASLSMSTGRMLQMMTTHRPIRMDFLHPDPADQIPRETFGFRSAISVPLLAGDEMLGMFTLVYLAEKSWSEQEIEYMLDIGKLLGVTVQHARIARKTADLEILLERKRLSGEIHDQFSQLVNTMNMGLETSLLSLAEGDTARVRRDLERTKSAGQEAARALREELLFLRHPLHESENLVHQVREHLARFTRQWGIQTELQVADGLEPLVVTAQMELQLLRILHESLANVLRHATASHVIVLLQGNRERLCMQILDNGRGFDPQEVSNERLGLRIMRERAQTVGGELTIASSNESGTTVCVNVPRRTS